MRSSIGDRLGIQEHGHSDPGGRPRIPATQELEAGESIINSSPSVQQIRTLPKKKQKQKYQKTGGYYSIGESLSTVHGVLGSIPSQGGRKFTEERQIDLNSGKMLGSTQGRDAQRKATLRYHFSMIRLAKGQTI